MQLMWLLEDELHIKLHIYKKKSNFHQNLRYEVLTAQRRYVYS